MTVKHQPMGTYGLTDNGALRFQKQFHPPIGKKPRKGNAVHDNGKPSVPKEPPEPEPILRRNVYTSNLPTQET